VPSTVPARISVLFVLAAAAAASDSSVAARQVPQFGEGAAGPAVDFAVVQANGTPVLDLRPAEVEIRINGRLRRVTSFRRVVTAPAPVEPGAGPAPAPPFGTNDTVATGRRIVFILDEESFVAGREALLRSAIDGLIATFTPADQAMVVALPFGGVKVPFTSDPARIRIATAGLSGKGARDETGSDLACRTRRFLDSLDGFLQGQAARTSPLTVVLFTAGLAGPRRDAPMALGPGMCELLVNHFERITALAGASRADFFLIQPDDIALAGGRLQESIGGSGFLGSDNPLEGIEHLAGSTGAVRVPLDATGTRALLRVARESSAYYVATIEPEPSEAYGRSRSLDVRVSRHGVTVRARPAITFAEPPRAAQAPRLAISDVLLSREAYADVPLRVGGFTVREPDGRLRVGVVVEPVDPSSSLGSVGAVLLDADGRAIARWFAADTLERPLLGAMVSRLGTYRLRVVVTDSAGRFGAAEDDVEVGLASVGSLSLGSLLLGLSRDEVVVPKLQFSAEPTAIASFDIYGGTAGTQLSAALELARSPGGPAFATWPLALVGAGESRVVATGVVPIGALKPGDYVVRGVIRLEDGTTGHVSRTLRKVAQEAVPAVR
jgi:hypothetical protein